MIVTTPNLLDSPSTLIAGEKSYQRHIACDLAFHAVEHGVRLVIAGDEQGDVAAWANEYQRWRASHGLPFGKEYRIVGFAGAYMLSRRPGLETQINAALKGCDERPAIIIREHNGFGDIATDLKRWADLAAVTLNKGSPFSFLSVASLGGAPFDLATLPFTTIYQTSYGFDHPAHVLRATEGTEVMVRRVKPAGAPLFCKASGAIDLIWKYGTEIGDFTQPIPA